MDAAGINQFSGCHLDESQSLLTLRQKVKMPDLLSYGISVYVLTGGTQKKAIKICPAPQQLKGSS